VLGAAASVSPAPGPSGGRRDPGAVQALVSAETAAAQEALDAVGTVSPGVAALLARIAAARAAHADLLAAAAELRAPGVLRTSASPASGAGGIPSPAPLPGTAPADPALGASATPSPGGTPASGTGSLSDATGAALTALTAGEHAAVYAYGAVVARVAPPDRARARDAWAWHTARRDVLEERLLAAGIQPPVAAPAYDLGGTLTTTRAVALAATVEDRLATLGARTVAAATGADRSDAAEGLVAGARRAAAWRGRPEALPG
jgi:Domain of unknown function (DUF4439)